MTHAYSSGTASFSAATFSGKCSLDSIILSNYACKTSFLAGNAIWEGPQTCGANYSIVCTGSANADLPCPCKANQSVVVTIVRASPIG
ncbi:hypothetical protein RHGRI_000104 [Rhododendron griersonianum]|uniref:Expansin-like EG45 domain-containing protein n=1 Tax=Rhododendron griersonianum TaxID=479676 RepID=A0AAV6LG62_9ERIC|nr:hypothetical protein RHGRI_000104 [Rhododendron griersonianum]